VLTLHACLSLGNEPNIPRFPQQILELRHDVIMIVKQAGIDALSSEMFKELDLK